MGKIVLKSKKVSKGEFLVPVHWLGWIYYLGILITITAGSIAGALIVDIMIFTEKNILVLITKATALSLIIGFTIGAFYLDKYININNVECLNNDCLDKRHGKKMV